MPEQTYFYNTSVEWFSHRRGKLRSQGLSYLAVSSPPEFKGEPGFWTPEHLFVAATESCLMATFLGISENSRLAVAGYSSKAKGKLELVEGSGLRFTAIEIFPAVELARAEDCERAERIMGKAAKTCLIANSMLTVVTVRPEFTVKEMDMAV